MRGNLLRVPPATALVKTGGRLIKHAREPGRAPDRLAGRLRCPWETESSHTGPRLLAPELLIVDSHDQMLLGLWAKV
jgi:hypothetical protein